MSYEEEFQKWLDEPLNIKGSPWGDTLRQFWSEAEIAAARRGYEQGRQKGEEERERFKRANEAAQKEISRLEKQRNDLVNTGEGLLHYLEYEYCIDTDDEYYIDFITAMKGAIDDPEELKRFGIPLLFQNTM